MVAEEEEGKKKKKKKTVERKKELRGESAMWIDMMDTDKDGACQDALRGTFMERKMCGKMLRMG